MIGTNEFITVATTRPETMLGDTAVAVNAKDERYTHLHGKKVLLPLMNREIPIITDELAQPEFGTGAVKVTPAHDPNDFQAGLRHNLPQINVMDEHAHMNQNAGPYAGLDRFEARKRVLADLQDAGIPRRQKDYTHRHRQVRPLRNRSLSRGSPSSGSSRSSRWPTAHAKSWRAARSRSSPDNYKHDLSELDEQHPRLVHLAPAVVGTSHSGVDLRRLQTRSSSPAKRRTKCTKCGERASSSRRPTCSTPGSRQACCPSPRWAGRRRRAIRQVFYPTTLLITAYEILFFWVARMIMFGCHFMQGHEQDRSDQESQRMKADKKDDSVPFREVYIHALVRDAERQKMSKTKGNVIDPLDVIEHYGTDATRFTLAAMAAPGTDIAFNESRTDGYRDFANKIWNAARFMFMNVDRIGFVWGQPPSAVQPGQSRGSSSHDSAVFQISSRTSLEDRWILSRFNRVAADVNDALKTYRFHEAANRIYDFFWGEFCDWYIELIKPRLNFEEGADRAAAQRGLRKSRQLVRRLAPPAASRDAVHHRRNLAGDLRWQAAAEVDCARGVSPSGREAVRSRRRNRDGDPARPDRQRAQSARRVESRAQGEGSDRGLRAPNRTFAR